MGHSFMENTQSGQIPEGRGIFIPNKALTLKLVPLNNSGTGAIPTFLIIEKK